MIDLNFRYECEKHKQLLNNQYFSNKKLSFVEMEDVFLVPFTDKTKSGAAYDSKGEIINETSTNKEYGFPKIDVSMSNEFDVFEQPCIYLGMFESCWGHFITDCLKKVWFLKTEQAGKFANYPLILLSPQTTSLKLNYRRLLEVLGIDSSRIVFINRNTIVKRIIVPDSSFYYDDASIIHYTNEFLETIKTIKDSFPNQDNAKYNKIYYSYSSFQKKKGYKKTFGEEKLDRFFKDRGFLIVHPENYSFDEQMEMLANCKCFASTEGSSSHNSIFLKDETNVIIIPRGPYFSGYQQTIDSMWNLNTYYVDSSLTAFASSKGPWSGPNYFYVSEQLMDYFGLTDSERIRYRKSNFNDLKKYLSYNCVDLSGRTYYIQNPYSEKFFYYLGLNSKKIFPFYYFRLKVKNLFKKIAHKK